jgi:polyhydroxyalkanoate synthesis regulator phasin
MNSDITQLLQKSFRVTLGATASLVEVIQDPQKRNENLSKISTELNQLAEEWAAKGEITEREARSFVDSMMAQAGQATDQSTTTTATSTDTTITTTATPASSPMVQTDIQELTAQIAAMRAEIDRLKAQDSSES